MNAQELFELAMKHIYGDGVPEDNDLATQLLTKAHEMGHVEATYNLGICYHYGFGTGIDLAKALDLAVIAEGVETEGQALLLKNMGCTCAQGYLYGRPMPEKDFLQYWQEKAMLF